MAESTHPATKRTKLIHQADQVMTQVELPPYRRPYSPLDLVAIEIILGCIFEAFQYISQAAVAGAAAIDDDKPLKRMGQPSLKEVLVPR
jgi:hypothetical protein